MFGPRQISRAPHVNKRPHSGGAQPAIDILVRVVKNVPLLMFSCLVVAGSALLLHAQQPATSLFNRPPEGVEENLRARVTSFYRWQMEGKFRQAESSVCEASKDAYYNGKKTAWLSFEIIAILFEHEFTTAKVSTALEAEMNLGAGLAKTKLPLTTLWKVEDDRWCLYIPPPSEEAVQTPFGQMSRAKPGTSSTPPPAKADQQGVWSGVSISKKELTLSSKNPSSDQLSVQNNLPGSVDLQLIRPSTPGLKATLSKLNLGAGQEATLLVEFEPREAAHIADVTLTLVVEPLSRRFPVRIRFIDESAK